MRVMLNQRIWRHAQRSSARTVAVSVQHGSSGLHAIVQPASSVISSSSRSCWTLVTPLSSAAIVRNTTMPSNSGRPTQITMARHAAMQVRSVYQASDNSGLLKREQDKPQKPLDIEASHLEILERAYKGTKNWQVAKDILDSVIATKGEGLTANVATALIEVFSARGRPLECLETLRFARDNGVRPRIHAYSSTIACCYKELQYSQALRVFEIMRNDGYVPQHVTYSRALSAAVKASHHELVLEIFDDMLRNRIDPNIVTYNTILNSCARNGDVHTALAVMRAIRERDIEPSQSSYHSLAICGAKTGRWELTHDAYHESKAAGFKPAMNMFNSVISAYAKGKQWDEIVDVYNEMPEEMQDSLQNTYLAGAMMAFAKSSDPVHRRKPIEIYETYKARGDVKEMNVFAHNAVLLCHLDAKEFDKLHEVTQEMKANGIAWDGLTYQYVILANVRAGKIKKAEQLLTKYGKKMKYSTLCYREVIEYYGEVAKDPLAACRFSMRMMQQNPRLSLQDWVTALTYAMQAENRSVYWNFRKWMKVRAAALEMPPELMLEEEDEVKPVQSG